MALIKNCLAKLVSAKRITQKQADDALALHEGMQGRLYPAMGPASADAASALEAARVMAQAARERKLTAAKDAIRLTENRNRMQLHSKGKTAGLMGVMTRDIYEDGKVGETINVESHSEGILKDLMRRADKMVTSYHSKFAGLSQDTESVWNVVRELFGRDSGDETAREAAAGWKAATDAAVARVRREGKRLSVLDDWRLPQFWDTKRVRNFSERAFVDDIMTEYEAGRLRIMDKQGQGEVARAAAGGVIANAYRDITLGHGQGTGGGFSNQLRVFRFDDPESYVRLMKKYGPGDGGLYRMMMGHLGSMAREISFIEMMGPNYLRNFEKLLEEAREDDTARMLAKSKKIGFGKAAVKVPLNRFSPLRSVTSPTAARRTFDYLAGNLGHVESDLMAGIFGAMRNIQTASRLGSAIVAAVPGDSVTAGYAANYNGISAAAVLSRVAKDLTVNRNGAEDLARQMNVTAHSVMEAALGAKRFEDEIVGDNLSGRLAEAVIRAQGLQGWTEALKRSFSMEFLGMVARQAGQKFEGLDPSFRGFLERNGFTPGDWDRLRVTPQLEAEGARFFDVSSVEDRRLGDRLMSAILDERQFAVIEPNARVKQLTTGGAARGTLWGEIARSSFMFKSFSMSIMMTHLMRGVTQGPIASRIWRMTGLFTMMTMAGAVTAQVGTMLTGKDPQDMSDPKFWGQAVIRGGGLGIYGDLVYASRTRGNTGVYELVAGPVFGALIGGITLAVGGQKLSGKTLAQYVKGFTPGSTLWYARVAVDRWIFDQMQMLIDPDYKKSFRRYERYLKKNFGQKFWWGQGKLAPSRAPDVGNAVGR